MFTILSLSKDLSPANGGISSCKVFLLIVLAAVGGRSTADVFNGEVAELA